MSRHKKKRALKHGSRQPQPRKPVTLPPAPWDMGATGPAANTPLRVVERRGDIDPETGKEINPNGIEGTRFLSVAELYFRRGKLTKRQFTAAELLAKAWEQKDRRPPAINGNRVDSSPKPDDRTAIIVDHVMAYVRIARHVPRRYAAFVNHVARDGKFLSSMPGYRKDGRYMDHLATGLDLLMDGLERRG